MIKLLALAVSCSFVALAAPVRAELDPPVPVRTVPPVFPLDMRRANVSGVVTINCLVDPHGEVQDLKVVKSTNVAFVQAALDALKKWRFKPAQRDGSAVPIRVTIPIRFSMAED
jgi:protein TonB